MVDVLPTLLDFSQPFNVPLLESTIAAFYTSQQQDQRAAAGQVLQAFQEHPQAWTRVDAILETAKTQDTKFYALQILEGVIKTRWAALPPEQREGIKNYASNLIIKYSTDEPLYRRESTFMGKLNVILVQILKQEWPAKWPSFIPDLVAASKTNQTLCENSMVILKLLSEEIFDFSRGELTQGKTKQLKNSLNDEFKLIHELCTFVLTNTRKPELIRATLVAMNAYLSWVPLGYIFQSNMVNLLLELFPQPDFRNIALQCLTEVGSLNLGMEYAPQFALFYRLFCGQLGTLVTPEVDLRTAYENGNEDQQVFVQNLSMFFTQFFKAHLSSLEQDPDSHTNLVWGLEILINVSYVDDVEVFKTCLDYWNLFTAEIYSLVCQVQQQTSSTAMLGPDGQLVDGQPGGGLLEGQAGMVGLVGGVQGAQAAMRKALETKLGMYDRVMRKLRALMITKMAKPEEVIVVEDENGNIVRETMKDNDVLMQYKTMREILVYLSNLNHQDTESQMLERLQQQMQGTWTWNGLNTLCWAIGSISGTFSEDQENRFLVTIIRDLLNLCESTRGKDNKAVIASNIMYVVGQYPKFLRQHWKFLKTVVNKLFEFMHETHPGVQDMACDTFLKISNKCKRKFVVLQHQEQQPFIQELLQGLAVTIQDLQPHQIHSFYESVGLMIGAEIDPTKRDEYLVALMTPPNNTWNTIIQQAAVNPEVLKQQEVIKSIQNVLQTNVAVCLSLGNPYTAQMGRILEQMLQLYRMYSEMITKTIVEGGPHAARSSFVKYMRGVKKSVLRLLEVFVEKCEDLQLLATHLVPMLMEPVLADYARSVPDARESEVLSLFAAIINKLKQLMEPMVGEVFKAVFTSTLEMITKNFEDYPEHRLRFFALLHAATNHCFSAIGQMSPEQIKLVIDSIVWAFRHTERNVAETGLQLLADMLENFSETPDAGTAFYQAYYLHLMREVFAVMTDTFHTPGFKLHCRILQHLFTIVRKNEIRAPLWDPATGTQYPNNALFVKDFATNLLRTSFPNMVPEQVEATVRGMLELEEKSMFKHHMRDFLVQTKTFGDKENADLFAEETQAKIEEQAKKLAAIPGMVSPHILPTPVDDMADG